MTRIASLVLALLFTSGCPFAGLEANPSRESLSRIAFAAADQSSSVSAYLYSIGATRKELLRDSLKTVCEIFADPAFRKRLKAQKRWLATAIPCATRTPAHDITPSYDELERDLLSCNFAPIHYFDNHNIAANATTDICPNRTSIDPSRIDTWGAEQKIDRADYLNTLAHELTHIVRSDPACDCTTTKPCLIKYTDEGHDTCLETQLVSYRLGDFVECHYRYPSSSQGERFERCLQRLRQVLDPQACEQRVTALVESCGDSAPAPASAAAPCPVTPGASP